LYDTELARSHLEEAAYSELSDLLKQLHQKMEEAANTIRCTNCGKRHKRIPVDRPCYAARMCSQCKIHHSAREVHLVTIVNEKPMSNLCFSVSG
jgi:DnaJ homolog subfamily C member 14